MEELVNKVAQSGIITIDLEKFYPSKEDIAAFDLKEFLFMGLILKEKDFRESLKNLDLTTFSGKTVAIHCSADAIIPVWAYMLAATVLKAVCRDIILAKPEEAINTILLNNIRKIDPAEYEDKRVVIKGCGEIPVPAEAYLEITNKLLPVAKSIMYGEPCSTVPIYKKKD